MHERPSFSLTFFFTEITLVHTGCAKKVIPQENFYISGIVADFFTKFTALTDEDSGQISCKFY